MRAENTALYNLYTNIVIIQCFFCVFIYPLCHTGNIIALHLEHSLVLFFLYCKKDFFNIVKETIWEGKRTQIHRNLNTVKEKNAFYQCCAWTIKLHTKSKSMRWKYFCIVWCLALISTYSKTCGRYCRLLYYPFATRFRHHFDFNDVTKCFRSSFNGLLYEIEVSF